MNDLKRQYRDCFKCSRRQNTVKVFGCGNLSAKIAIIGEEPCEEEVAKVIPFVGQAGELLDRILVAIDLSRGDLFFTNAILCRTDNKNRQTTVEEYSNCRLRLFQELSIVKPKFSILVGNIALRSIMGDDTLHVFNTHGRWFTTLNDPCYFYYSIYHPSWILSASTPGEEKARKKIMWEDIKKFRDDIESLGEIFENQGEVCHEVVGERGKGSECQILP